MGPEWRSVLPSAITEGLKGSLFQFGGDFLASVAAGGGVQHATCGDLRDRLCVGCVWAKTCDRKPGTAEDPPRWEFRIWPNGRTEFQCREFIPYQCDQCGGLTDAFRFVSRSLILGTSEFPEVPDHTRRMDEGRICYSCNFWWERSNPETDMAGHLRSVVLEIPAGRAAYWIGDEDAPPGRGRGFYGDAWHLAMGDGRRIRTTNLNCNGLVPVNFHDRLPVNAVHVVKPEEIEGVEWETITSDDA